MQLSFSTARKLRPAWTFEAGVGHVLWKLLPSADGVLVVERRDPVAYESEILGLELGSGRELWRAHSPFEPWWTNLSYSSERFVLLEGYAKRDMPIAQGVAALDLHSGVLRWTEPVARLASISGGAICLHFTDYGVEQTRWVDGYSGNIVDEPSCDDVQTAANTNYPATLSGREFPTTLRTLLSAEFLESAEGLWHNDKIVACGHTKNRQDPSNLLQQTYQSELVVIANAKVVYRETLAASSPFPLSGNFVVDHDLLIYVQETHRLACVPLS